MIILCAIAALVCGAGLYFYARHWEPSREAFPLQGVDVSEAQGPIHWPSVKAAGAGFAYIRASIGDKRDPNFEDNWAKAAAAGLSRGAILVVDLCKPANDQATEFIATVPREADALPPAIELDLAHSCDPPPAAPAVRSLIQQLVSAVEAHSGKHAIIAVSHDFDGIYAVTADIDRTFWLRRSFLQPNYGKDWVMWRASTMRRIDGIDGPVHWNVIRP